MNWIGYRVLDSLITYPDAWFLSRTAFPIQNERRWNDTTHRWVTRATMSVLSTAPAHTTYPHAHSAITICSEWRPHTPFFWAAGTQAHPGLHVHPAHTPHVTRASRNHTWLPLMAQTKRARTNRSGRATYSAQALGRLPWFAPCLRRSRRLRPRFDMSFSLGLLSRLKHFCTHWPKPPRHRPFAATKVTEKRAATPASSARAARRDHALSQRS